jgi:outer membrane lipoprotein carrier protein
MRIGLFFIGLLFGSALMAGEPPEVVDAPLADSEQDSAAERLRQGIENTQSLRGQFRQRSVDADGFVLEDSAGDFWFVAPNRFRWQYLEPFEQLIVADGERVWMYDIELEQVSVREQAQDITQSPMVLLGDPDQIDQQFEVQAGAPENGVDRLLLVPRDEQGDFDRVLVLLNDGVITGITVRDAFGQVTELTLSAVEVNPDIAASQFTFSPPEGVDVVGLDGSQ